MKRLLSLTLFALLLPSLVDAGTIRHVKATDQSCPATPRTGLAPADVTARIIVSGGTLTTVTAESITTLGTYQAPSSVSAIRFRELDATNAPGWYEIHFHDSQLIGQNVELHLILAATNARFEDCKVCIVPSVGLADGVTHGGSAALLSLERMVVTSTTTNEPAVKLGGNGTAPGLLAVGGQYGHGAWWKGGSSSGDGQRSEAQAGNGSGLQVLGVGTGHGLRGECLGTIGSGAHFRGGSGGDGISANGFLTGGGLAVHGGGDKGSGSGNGPGFYAAADGTGAGAQLANFTGGKGLLINSTNAAGVHILSNGTQAHGFVITPGTTTSHSVLINAGSTGGYHSVILGGSTSQAGDATFSGLLKVVGQLKLQGGIASP